MAVDEGVGTQSVQALVSDTALTQQEKSTFILLPYPKYNTTRRPLYLRLELILETGEGVVAVGR